MKKLLLGLGTLSLIALPTLTIISCSSTTTTTTSTLTLKDAPIITTTIASAALAESANNANKLTLFNLIWTSNPTLTEDDMKNITFTKKAGTNDTSKFIFTVTSTGSIVLAGELESGEITLTTTTTSTLSLKATPSVTTEIASAGIAEGANEAAKFALFDAIWTTTSSPALTVDDMTDITITQSDGSAGAKIFTVASTGSIVLEGTKVSGEITLTTNTLTLQGATTTTTAIATAAMDGTPSNANKLILFNLIWTSNPALTEDDMETITFTKKAGTNDTSKFIFTVEASTGSIILEGELESGEITLTTTSELTLKLTPSVTTEIATAGVAGGAGNPAKFTLFDLIWTGNPTLDADDMTDITITQSDGSAGAKIFTVASTGSIVLEGTKVSGEITLTTTSTLSLKDNPVVTTAIANAAITGTPDNAAKWALFNLIWTGNPVLEETNMANITITQTIGSTGKVKFTVASTNLNLVLSGSFESREITLTIPGAIKPTTTDTAQQKVTIEAIETYQTAESANAGSGDKDALITALNLTAFTGIIKADLSNFVITIDKTEGSETITLTAKSGFIFGTGDTLISKVRILIPGSLNTAEVITSVNQITTIDAIKVYQTAETENAGSGDKDALITALNLTAFTGITKADLSNFVITYDNYETPGIETITLTANSGFSFGTGDTLISKVAIIAGASRAPVEQQHMTFLIDGINIYNASSHTYEDKKTLINKMLAQQFSNLKLEDFIAGKFSVAYTNNTVVATAKSGFTFATGSKIISTVK